MGKGDYLQTALDAYTLVGSGGFPSWTQRVLRGGVRGERVESEWGLRGRGEKGERERVLRGVERER